MSVAPHRSPGPPGRFSFSLGEMLRGRSNSIQCCRRCSPPVEAVYAARCSIPLPLQRGARLERRHVGAECSALLGQGAGTIPYRSALPFHTASVARRRTSTRPHSPLTRWHKAAGRPQLCCNRIPSELFEVLSALLKLTRQEAPPGGRPSAASSSHSGSLCEDRSDGAGALQSDKGFGVCISLHRRAVATGASPCG